MPPRRTGIGAADGVRYLATSIGRRITRFSRTPSLVRHVETLHGWAWRRQAPKQLVTRAPGVRTLQSPLVNPPADDLLRLAACHRPRLPRCAVHALKPPRIRGTTPRWRRHAASLSIGGVTPPRYPLAASRRLAIEERDRDAVEFGIRRLRNHRIENFSVRICLQPRSHSFAQRNSLPKHGRREHLDPSNQTRRRHEVDCTKAFPILQHKWPPVSDRISPAALFPPGRRPRSRRPVMARPRTRGASIR